MQVLSAKLIRCEMINIVSNSRVSRTHTVGFSIGFLKYFSGRRWKIDGWTRGTAEPALTSQPEIPIDGCPR